MERKENSSDRKERLFYGAVIGAIVGMIIGTMPQNEPQFAVASMMISATVLGLLTALSDSFWESLRAAWELLRMAFWRW